MHRFLVFAGLLVTCLAAVPRLDKALPSHTYRLRGRIVGGTEVSIKEIPYQLSLQWNVFYLCGASLIRSDVALTAAHCMLTSETAYFFFRGGSEDKNSGGQVVTVNRAIVHDKYKGYDYDFSLFLLRSHFKLGENVNLIPLPKQDQDIPAGSLAVTSGWGRTEEDGQYSDTVRAVQLPIVDQKECNEAYGKDGFNVTDAEICAGFLGEGGKDACQGDSGGPLVVDGVLVGVTSWGIGCARPDFPGVWARVPIAVDWIKANLQT